MVGELRPEESVKRGVASLTIRDRKARRVGQMRGIVSLPIRCQVAARRSARGRESLELPGCGIGVAHVAFHHGVRSQQRKSIEVVLDRLHRYIPAGGSMAPGAVGAHLTAVNIRVAIRAILAHVGENGFRVAFRAANFFVHSAKRVARGVVIEFGNSTNRGPACARMAVFARNSQGAMRTPTRLLLGVCGANKGQRQNH